MHAHTKYDTYLSSMRALEQCQPATCMHACIPQAYSKGPSCNNKLEGAALADKVHADQSTKGLVAGS